MNMTIVRITARALIGRKRFLLLLPLPVLMVGLAVLANSVGAHSDWVQPVVVGLGFAVVLPVVALIVGTGVLSSEIDDGTLAHILAKPLPRSQIILSKLAVAVVMLTMYKEEMLFNEAMNAGIPGFVLKENAASDLLGCIHAVVGGQPYISPSLSAFLLNRKKGAQKLIEEKPELEKLTAAEQRILKLIAEDLTSKEIAERLGISAHTVENHRAKICERLNLRGSHSLLKFAYDNKSRL